MMKHIIYHRPTRTYLKGFSKIMDFGSLEEAEEHIEIIAHNESLRTKRLVSDIISEYSPINLSGPRLKRIEKNLNEAESNPQAARSIHSAIKHVRHIQKDCQCGFWLNCGFDKYCPCDGNIPKSLHP